MKKRFNWLDSARGLAFCVVIYCHLQYCIPEVMRFMSPFFLTTFFFVSGYLFKCTEGFGKVLEQRTRTLLLPYFLLGFFLVGIKHIWSLHSPSIGFWEDYWNYIILNGKNPTLWFVGALYAYSIVFYWIERIFNRRGEYKVLFLCVIMMMFVLNSLLIHYFHIPVINYHLQCSGFACFYMGLGLLYREKEAIIDAIILKKSKMIIMAIVYFAWILISRQYYTFGGSKYVLDSIIITIIGLCLVVYSSKTFLNKNKLLLFVGSNSLLYFALHGKLFSILQKVISKCVPQMFNDYYLEKLMLGIVITFCVIVILVIPIKLINRYCPQIIGKGFKLWQI